ncbi:MAG TPA: VWA domain-containing protein [Candidatus Lokiarchaeia archaeon]
MDNPLENKNSDKLKENKEDELRDKAEKFAKEVPYSEFGGPARQAGILIEGDSLATWYRGIAKNLIEIKIYEGKSRGELIPIYSDVWRIGDPLEELDVVQSLLNSPKLIPNLTTRKWIFEEGSGYLKEKQIPDLLLVIDSSGSMNWKYLAKNKNQRGNYHIALVASFAALHYAARKGVKFSTINFSNRADLCDWTMDYQKAERILLRYQGGGTVLPLEEIENQCNKTEKKILVFIITDFGIYNWGGAKKSMIKLAERGHKIVGFFIGSSKIPKLKFRNLLDKVTFYPINEIDDLVNLVIEEIKKYYD